MYFTLEDGNENCIEKLYRIDEVIEFVKTHDSVKEIFLFCNDEVIASWLSENFNLPSIQNVTYENDVQRVGTVSENSLIGGRVIGIEGVCFTLMACTHGYGMGNIYDNRRLVLDEKYYINSERAIQLCRRLDEESDLRER